MAWKHLPFVVFTIGFLSAGFLGGLTYAYAAGNPLGTNTTTGQSEAAAASMQLNGTEPCPTPTPDQPEVVEIDINVTEQQESVAFQVRVTNPDSYYALTIHRENFRLLDGNNTVHLPYNTWGQGEEALFPRSVTLQPGQAAAGYLIFDGRYNDTHAIEYVSDHGGVYGYTLLDTEST